LAYFFASGRNRLGIRTGVRSPARWRLVRRRELTSGGIRKEEICRRSSLGKTRRDMIFEGDGCRAPLWWVNRGGRGEVGAKLPKVDGNPAPGTVRQCKVPSP